MKTGQETGLSSQQAKSEKPVSRKASFSLIMSTVAIVLLMLLVAALYYYNTNTQLTP